MPGMKRDCGGAAAILGAFSAAVKQVSVCDKGQRSECEARVRGQCVKQGSEVRVCETRVRGQCVKQGSEVRV